MAFYGLRFGETSTKHPAMKSRGLDNRFFGSNVGQRTVRQDPLAHQMVGSGAASAAVSQSQAVPRPASSGVSSKAESTVNTSSPQFDPSGLQSLTVPPAAQIESIFRRLDYNGNGKLSLAEIDRGVSEIWPQYNNKPAIMRAYKAADADGDGYLTIHELPLFVKYLGRFNDLWLAYRAADTNGDRRISQTEFVRGREAFGLSHRTPREAEEIFQAVDTNGGGMILFDELAAYIAGSELNAERQILRHTLHRPTEERATQRQIGFLQLPSLAKEQDLFSRLDVNRNGMLSLAELDKGVVELWPQFNNKPALMRAYKAADGNGNGFLGRQEFKAFLTFLVVYTNLFQRFSRMDTNGDRRLTLNEFLKAGAESGRGVTELRDIFAKLDTNRGGYILFDEYCAYEAQGTLERLLRSNPSALNPPRSVRRACIPGLVCLHCGKSVPDYDAHVPGCRSDHIKAVQLLPEFLHISVPEMPLPTPELQSQVSVFNDTARRIYEGLSVISCPECSRRFPCNLFAGHFKTHSISYDRRMALMRQAGRDIRDVALPRAIHRPDQDETIEGLRRSLMDGFDATRLLGLRRLLFLQSKQQPMLSAGELQRILGQCGLTGERTYPTDLCCVVLGTFDKSELGSATTLLARLDPPLSTYREHVVGNCLRTLDPEGTQQIPFRVIRNSLTNVELVKSFARPLERVVTKREFEQRARDFSCLFADDATFGAIFACVSMGETDSTDGFNVLATLASGSKMIVRIETPPGTLVRKDTRSLLRRLTLLGIDDAVKVELL